MRLLLVCLGMVLCWSAQQGTAFAQAQPTPKLFQVGEAIWVEVFFERLLQGQAGIIAIEGEGITAVTATFLGSL
ncbi:MAG UNVERIFIED_CONTAM: hypothetical protein LVT10_20910 [Anaerolineae bacterium]